MAVRSANEMVADAKAKIENLTPAEAQRRVDDEGALIVDIRDIRELQRDGCIPGAHHCPRGMLEFWFSPDSPYTKDVFQEDREFILCCGGGLRSALSTVLLQEMGVPKVTHVDTGFGGWKAEMPVEDHDTWKANRKA